MQEVCVEQQCPNSDAEAIYFNPSSRVGEIIRLKTSLFPSNFWINNEKSPSGFFLPRILRGLGKVFKKIFRPMRKEEIQWVIKVLGARDIFRDKAPMSRGHKVVACHVVAKTCCR